MGWDGPTTYRQFAAWRVWNTFPTKDHLYSMQTAQLLDAILHMFDKTWKGKALGEYEMGKPRVPVKAPEKKPGKVPVSEGDWWPTPLTAEDIKRASSKLGMRAIAEQASGGK